MADAAADAVERRRAQLEARMAQRAEAQQQRGDARAPDEDVDAFKAEIRAAGDAVQARVRDALADRALLADKARAAEAFDAIAVDAAALQGRLSSAQHFLPGYELRSLQAQLKALDDHVLEARGKAIPRKTFAFSAGKGIRRTDTAQAAQAARAAAARTADVDSGGGVIDPDHSVAEKTGETVVRHAAALCGHDFVLSRLTDCTVWLLGPVTALRMSRLVRCRVYAGPCSGSVHLEDCTDSVLHLASHQLRIHKSFDCSFYVFVRSDPIIEDCDHCGFAPYSLAYPGIAAHAQDASLAIDSPTQNHWDAVQDFKWLKATASPHWSVIAPDARVSAPAAPASSDAAVVVEDPDEF